MLILNVWPFVIIAILVTPATPSHKQDSVNTQRNWPKDRHHSLSKRAIPPPFFAGDRRPEGLPRISDGTEIPQYLPSGTGPYFVSLFDEKRNIPIYSAYKVTPQQAAGIGTNSRVDSTWRNPKDAKGQGIPVDAAYKEAITTDKQKLSRGHMNPSGINSFNQDFMKATFTLTNAAPQFKSLNEGSWREYEDRIRQYAKCPCGNDIRGGTLYLLTGTSDFGLRPGGGGTPVQDTTIPLPYTKNKFHGNTVDLVTPRAVWTAGCCVWNEPGKVFGSYWQSAKAESFAVMSNNQNDPSLLHQTEMSVAKLEDLLTEPGKPKVNLFPGNNQCRNPGNPGFKLPL